MSHEQDPTGSDAEDASGEAGQREAPAEGAREPSQARKGPAILVVDDDADHNLVMTLSLATLGYEVLAADSCSAALATLAGRRVDVLVSDLSLGDGSALDLMRSIGDARPRVAVVLTGFDDVGADVRRVFDEVLLKPTTVDVVDAVVKARLAHKPLAKASIETLRRRGAAWALSTWPEA